MVPAAELARPHTFLSLAPMTSSSYPVRKPSVTAPKADGLAPEIIAAMEKTRRSSSLSSNGSGAGKMRFLKLGPVHSGVHEGEEGDWSEEVVVG